MPRRKWAVGSVVLLSAAFAATAGNARGAIVSTFDDGTESWFRGAGDSNSLVVWSATGGNPGGCLTMQDQAGGTTDYWYAPAKFLGDQSSAYGGTLSYDLKIDRAGQNFVDLDVALVGGGHSVSGLFNVTPTLAAYTNVVIPLKESAAWHGDGSGGGPPTAAFFQAILANLSSLQIRADYLNGVEVDSLDNVTLSSSVPEPSSAAMLLIAAGGAAAAVRRRGRRRPI